MSRKPLSIIELCLLVPLAAVIFGIALGMFFIASYAVSVPQSLVDEMYVDKSMMEGEPIITHIDRLRDAWSRDVRKANKMFAGKHIVVTGKVSAVIEDDEGSVSEINLMSDHDLSLYLYPLKCVLDADHIHDFKKGEVLDIEGVIRGSEFWNGVKLYYGKAYRVASSVESTAATSSTTD